MKRDLVKRLDGFIVGVGAVLLAFTLGRCDQPSQPEPAPIPAAVADTGWHEALDAYGDFYFIELPYSEMNDSQRDDANRFGRLYPSGHE